MIMCLVTSYSAPDTQRDKESAWGARQRLESKPSTQTHWRSCEASLETQHLKEQEDEQFKRLRLDKQAANPARDLTVTGKHVPCHRIHSTCTRAEMDARKHNSDSPLRNTHNTTKNSHSPLKNTHNTTKIGKYTQQSKTYHRYHQDPALHTPTHTCDDKFLRTPCVHSAYTYDDHIILSHTSIRSPTLPSSLSQCALVQMYTCVRSCVYAGLFKYWTCYDRDDSMHTHDDVPSMSMRRYMMSCGLTVSFMYRTMSIVSTYTQSKVRWYAQFAFAKEIAYNLSETFYSCHEGVYHLSNSFPVCFEATYHSSHTICSCYEASYHWSSKNSFCSEATFHLSCVICSCHEAA